MKSNNNQLSISLTVLRLAGWFSLESYVGAVGQSPWNHPDSFHTHLSVSWAGKTQTAGGWNRWDSLSISISMWPFQVVSPTRQLQDSCTSYTEAQGYRGKFQERKPGKTRITFYDIALHLALFHHGPLLVEAVTEARAGSRERVIDPNSWCRSGKVQEQHARCRILLWPLGENTVCHRK